MDQKKKKKLAKKEQNWGKISHARHMRPASHRQVDPTRVEPTYLWEDGLMRLAYEIPTPKLELHVVWLFHVIVVVKKQKKSNWDTIHVHMVGTLQFSLHYFPFVEESILKLLKLFPNGNYMLYLFIDRSGRHASFVHWPRPKIKRNCTWLLFFSPLNPLLQNVLQWDVCNSLLERCHFLKILILELLLEISRFGKLKGESRSWQWIWEDLSLLS